MYFLTDPLCPWSWAMEPLVSALHKRDDVALHPILAAWLPSLAVKSRDAAKAEWAEAAAKTGARIDPAYWDRVAPRTSLIALAAVEAAILQGTAKGWAFLSALRRAIFERGADPTMFEALLALAAPSGLKTDLFDVDLGIGRYTADDVVSALGDGSLSERVGWFGRRWMLRSWESLAADLRTAERHGLSPPALHILHGKKETALKGFANADDVERAIRSVL